MDKIRNISAFSLILLFCFSCISNIRAQVTLVSDTIPFEIVSSKIVISVEVNGKPTRYIVDTGGRNLITSDSIESRGVRLTGQEMTSDVNSKGRAMYKGVMPNLKIGKVINLKNVNTLVMPPQRYFRELGVVGALGGEAFSKVCVSIHSREKYIILTYPYRPKGISRKDGITMQMGNNFHSVIPVKIGNVTLNTLFDTGMHSFLHLNNPDYETLKNANECTTEAKGSGLWHVGVGGVSSMPDKSADKVSVNELIVHNKKFTHVGTLTQERNYSIIGLDLIKYGNVMLDYPRGLFYFFPFDNEAIDLSGVTKLWNVKILPIENHFEVTGIIGEIDVKQGEYVWNINGTELTEDTPLSEEYITNLINSVDTDTGYILVGKTAAKTRKVEIRKI